MKPGAWGSDLSRGSTTRDGLRAGDLTLDFPATSNTSYSYSTPSCVYVHAFPRTIPMV